MKKIFLFFLVLSSSCLIFAQEGLIPFDSGRWQIVRGDTAQYLGMQSFYGRAVLKDTDFENGTIEFDLALNGDRSYPGIFLRVQNPGDYEHFYLRPHRSWYNDAVQYAPAHKGASCWQLFNGDGYTAAYRFPYDQWMHVTIVVKGEQALVYIDDMKTPVLHVSHLDHGSSKGGISIDSPANGSAHFANFKVSDAVPEDFPVALKQEIPYGMIREWEVSDILKFADIDPGEHPSSQDLGQLDWKKIPADPSGLVNLSKVYPRTHRGGDAAYVRTTIHAEEDMVKAISFGYSDIISVFLNGQIYFTGLSTYRSRDLSFLGIIGLNDQVYLPLKKGDNELLLMMAEGFGGWGFMMQTSDVFVDDRMIEKWETEEVFKVPESVIYDREEDVLYVTNFDQLTRNTSGREQYISRISSGGEVIDLVFIDSLDNPLGMKLHKRQLYIVEKNGIAIADLKSAKVIRRINIPGCQFPNDVEVDDQGRIYVSDSRKNVVWRIIDGEAEVWLEEGRVLDPNTMRIINQQLYVGNSGFQQLNAYALDTRDMEVIADFGPGFIDGIRSLPDNELLVSLWDGKLYHVSRDGKVENLLDLKNSGIYIADFEYVHENKTLYIPGFFYDKVIAYEINW